MSVACTCRRMSRKQRKNAVAVTEEARSFSARPTAIPGSGGLWRYPPCLSDIIVFKRIRCALLTGQLYSHIVFKMKDNVPRVMLRELRDAIMCGCPKGS